MMTDWISVKDRLPKAKETVIGYEAAFDSIGLVYREPDSETFIDCDGFYSLDTVTHWMPLPEPPKGAAND